MLKKWLGGFRLWRITKFKDVSQRHGIGSSAKCERQNAARAERGERRLAHWRSVVVAACEQCGRNRLPPVAAPVALPEWVAAWPGRGVVLAPQASRTLAALAAPVPPVALAVGPEGGFTEGELDAARAAGFADVALGPRVLRTETAAVAALAAMQALWGDLR